MVNALTLLRLLRSRFLMMNKSLPAGGAGVQPDKRPNPDMVSVTSA
jgi:hypothetical protein